MPTTVTPVAKKEYAMFEIDLDTANKKQAK
jgi:hypothetical protein